MDVYSRWQYMIEISMLKQEVEEHVRWTVHHALCSAPRRVRSMQDPTTSNVRHLKLGQLNSRTAQEAH